MESPVKNMFDGSVFPVTLRLSIPFFLSNFLSLLYLIIDTYFISRIDPESTALISGTGLVFPVYFLFISLSVGISIGVGTLVARAIGEKNIPVLECSADSGMLLALIIALISIPAGYIYGPEIMNILAGKEMSAVAVGYGLEYFYYLLPGLALLLLGHVLIGVLQGEGLTRHIATASIISTLLNCVLDPLFIFTFKMGVAGASLATSISIGITAVYVIAIFLKKRSSIPIHWSFFRARRDLVTEIVRIGSLQSLGMLSVSLTFMFLNNLVSSIGQEVMNSWALCGRTDQIVLIPAFAVSGATITMAGQNYGRNRLERVADIYRLNMVLGVLMVLFLAVVYNLFSFRLFSLFSSVPAVIEGSVTQIRYLSFTFTGVAAGMISGAVFQATGKPVPAFIITLFRMFCIALPLAFLLVTYFDMGIIGVFIGLGAGNFLALPLSLLWTLRHLKKLEFRIVDDTR